MFVFYPTSYKLYNQSKHKSFAIYFKHFMINIWKSNFDCGHVSSEKPYFPKLENNETQLEQFMHYTKTL